MSGFPATGDAVVSLENWQESPNVEWAFQHMRELMPTQSIPTDPARVRPLVTAPRVAVLDADVHRLDGSTGSASEVFDDTRTDALLVLHDGVVVEERYLGAMTPLTPHLLMSVSKSVVGCVAGVLAHQGLLDPSAPVTSYVDDVRGSGYDGATVRDLLDMRTGVAFRETYDEPDTEVRVMERSMGWRPIREGDPLGMYQYLTTLGRSGPHNEAFTYRSADTDMLGWVCERAAGVRMADLVSQLLWVPMGAEHDADITCDRFGSAVHDGGISAVARDLARFGQLLLEEGAVGGHQVVPRSWLLESWQAPAEVREAFASTDNEVVLPGGWYRNQFWFVPHGHGTALVCLGIHGQMVWVDRGSRTVGVKLSSWPTPQNTAYLVDTMRAFAAIARHNLEHATAGPTALA